MELCKKLGDLYSNMIFINGFVHSDPHPGNILIRQDPEDKEVSVFLLDHGLYAVSCILLSVKMEIIRLKLMQMPIDYVNVDKRVCQKKLHESMS